MVLLFYAATFWFKSEVHLLYVMMEEEFHVTLRNTHFYLLKFNLL